MLNHKSDSLPERPGIETDGRSPDGVEINLKVWPPK